MKMVKKHRVGEKRKYDGKMFTLLEISILRQHSPSEKYGGEGYTHFKTFFFHLASEKIGKWYLYGRKAGKRNMGGR